jgi:hypothetical protein
MVLAFTLPDSSQDEGRSRRDQEPPMAKEKKGALKKS